MLSDGSDLTWAGNAFQALAAATGEARSPSVERLVGGTSSVTASLDRLRRLMLRLEVRRTDLAQISPDKTKFHLIRHVTSRHDTTCSTCRARRDERFEPCCSTSSTQPKCTVQYQTCLVENMYEQLAQGRTRQHSGWDRTGDLQAQVQRPNHYAYVTKPNYMVLQKHREIDKHLNEMKTHKTNEYY